MKDRAQFHFNYWMIAILVFLGSQYLLSTQQQVATIPYSEFEQHLKDGRIDELAITERRIEGRLRAPGRRPAPFHHQPRRAAAGRASAAVPGTLHRQVESTLVRDLLSWIVPAMLFFGIWLFLLKRIGSGLGAAA